MEYSCECENLLNTHADQLTSLCIKNFKWIYGKQISLTLGFCESAYYVMGLRLGGRVYVRGTALILVPPEKTDDRITKPNLWNCELSSSYD